MVKLVSIVFFITKIFSIFKILKQLELIFTTVPLPNNANFQQNTYTHVNLPLIYSFYLIITPPPSPRPFLFHAYINRKTSLTILY